MTNIFIFIIGAVAGIIAGALIWRKNGAKIEADAAKLKGLK